MAAFTAIALAGLALGAFGQVEAGEEKNAAGQANQAAADSQASLDDFNASVADEQAQDAIDRGNEQESQYRTQVRGAIGALRAGAAASNVDAGFGSPVDTQADAAFLGEMDALTIRTNATREAWGYQVQATDYRNRATVARQTGVYAADAGEAAETTSDIGAAGSLLTGGANLLQTRYGLQHAGT